MTAPTTPARRAALLRLLEDYEYGIASTYADLTADDDMMIWWLMERGELTWLRADLWTLTPAGLAAARAEREKAG